MYPAYVTNSPDAQLAYPHYSDRRWQKPQLIYHDGCVKHSRRRPNAFEWRDANPRQDEGFDFHAAPKTDECNYSDRIWQWDYEKAHAASKQCETEKLSLRTARGIERFLSLYHDKPVTLRYVLGGVNLSSGYEYYVYGYDYKAEPQGSQS